MENFQKIQNAFDCQDYAEAIAIGLIDHANSGNRGAQEMLGNCYQLGLGMPVGINQAVYWYEQAIALGSGLAANNLAGILAYGYTGHPPDRQRAQSLLEKARALGFDHAPKQLLS